MGLWSAILLGLAGSLHCAAMCGPLVLALARSRPPGRGGAAGRVSYHAGRVASYCLLGATLGLCGHMAVVAGLQRWLSIALGVALLGGLLAATKISIAAPVMKWVALLKNTMHARLRRDSLASQAVLGALNGLLPCGLVYVAAAGAAATGHPLSGAAYMACFGLGTWPMMAGLHFSGRRVRLPSRFSWNRMARAVVALMAVLLILRGLELGIPMLSPDLSAGLGGDGRCH